jgi:hypothetical protein
MEQQTVAVTLNGVTHHMTKEQIVEELKKYDKVVSCELQKQRELRLTQTILELTVATPLLAVGAMIESFIMRPAVIIGALLGKPLQPRHWPK